MPQRWELPSIAWSQAWNMTFNPCQSLIGGPDDQREAAHRGNTTVTATRLGAYRAIETLTGDFPRLALGITVPCRFVLVFNRLVWRRLDRLAEERLRLD